VLFTSSHSEFLNLISTLGIIGTVAWIVLLLSMLRIALPMKKETRSMSIGVAVLILEQFLLPSTTVNTVVLFVTATMLAIKLKQAKDERTSDILLHLFAIRIVAPGTADKVQQHLASRALAIGIALAVLVGIGTSAYFWVAYTQLMY
jgi:O-antigen ligase